MKIGKLSAAQLHGAVLSVMNKESQSPQAKVGEDVAYHEVNARYIAVSTDPITGATKDIGSLAVTVSCNDVAAGGAVPKGILMTLLLPPDASIEEIEEIARDAAAAASDLGVDVLGGHTEVTSAVTRPVISCTVFGECEHIPPGIQEGDAIILTRKIGMEATGILVKEREELRSILSEEEIQEALRLSENISVLPEAKIAMGYGVHRMHDVTEGGLLGALSEMVFDKRFGFDIELELVEMAPVTEKIARFYNIDPYQLLSSGSMIITLEDARADGLIEELTAAGISASRIGRFTSDPQRRVRRAGEEIDVELCEVDEIYRVVES